MSWYRDSDGGEWAERVALSVVGDATGTIDCTFAMPADFDEFWSAIDASGFDIRVTDSDGLTLLDYQWDSFDKTARTGTVQVDDIALTQDQLKVLWLYWQPDDTSDDDDASTSFVVASPRGGAITLEVATPATTVRAVRETPGTTTPSQTVHKTADETIWVHWDFSGLLLPRFNRTQNSRAYEEVDSALCEVLLSGAAQAAMEDHPGTRALPTAPSTAIIRQEVTGGTAGTDYTLRCLMTTDKGRTLEARALLRVNDPDES